MVEKICNKYGLQIKQIEKDVYQVLDPDKEVDVDQLKREINNCLLIISERLRWSRDSTGVCSRISHVYYIITDYNADEKAIQYRNLMKEKYGKAYIFQRILVIRQYWGWIF